MNRTEAARKVAEYHNEGVQRKVDQETAAADEQATRRTHSIVAQRNRGIPAEGSGDYQG